MKKWTILNIVCVASLMAFVGAIHAEDEKDQKNFELIQRTIEKHFQTSLDAMSEVQKVQVGVQREIIKKTRIDETIKNNVNTAVPGIDSDVLNDYSTAQRELIETMPENISHENFLKQLSKIKVSFNIDGLIKEHTDEEVNLFSWKIKRGMGSKSSGTFLELQ